MPDPLPLLWWWWPLLEAADPLFEAGDPLFDGVDPLFEGGDPVLDGGELLCAGACGIVVEVALGGADERGALDPRDG